MTGGPDDREDAANEDLSLHALEYHWDEFDPHLYCYDTLAEDACELDLSDVDFEVSRRKVCVGRWDDHGKHIPCPKQTPVDRFGQCPECSRESFLPVQECVFEPLCDGERCDSDFCRREHVLYIAFFDNKRKIGMSSTRRIERRLIEQGADAYSIIGKFASRLKARTAEKALSDKLRIPQAYRQEELLQNLSRPVDVRGIEGRFEALVMTLGEGFDPEPLKWLDGYPIELPLKRIPKLRQSPGKHKGEYVGVKGKWVIYEDDGLKALNLSDFPSRFLARHVA
ncbi:MAG TPA: DUF2797 domain-containing protein [Thermoplasmata archaeon]|jgi:hypothetical protein